MQVQTSKNIHYTNSLTAANIVALLLSPALKCLTQDYQLQLYGNYSVFVDKEVSYIIQCFTF